MIATVLFACVHNAGRSQMAAAWFNAMSDARKARARSAGTAPASRVHPEVTEVMREVSMDLADVQPVFLSDELARGTSLLITMGCGEACPVVPGLRRDDWPIEDPKGRPVERVRESVVVRAKSAAAAARRSGRQPLATRWSTKRRPRRRRGPSSLA